MEIRYPEYYKQFRCLAGECPDTCCVAWEIRVDRETAGLYKELSKERNRLGRKLKARIRRGKIVPEGEFCPFLGVDHLCDIQRTHGEKALCRACRQYPRHMEDYGALQEMLLLMSCPEAARLILTGGEGFCLRKRPESKESAEKQAEGIDRELLWALLTVRERLFQILSDRRESLDFRLMTVLKICYELQKQIEAGEEKQIEADLDAVLKVADPKSSWRSSWEKKEALLEAKRFSFMADRMAEIASFDRISRKWPAMLEQCRSILYHSEGSRERYAKDRERFLEEWPEAELQWERICRYFLYSFFLTALYDGKVFAKAKMAVFCTFMIEDLYLASWRKDEGREIWNREEPQKRLAEQVKICQTAARQIENSAENRDRLERLLDPSSIKTDDLSRKIGGRFQQLKDQLGGFLRRSHASHGDLLQ